MDPEAILLETHN